MRLPGWILLSTLARVSVACVGGTGSPCTAGATRTCSLSLEGGYAQSGSQSCNADNTWAECVGTGACSGAPGGTSSAYARCDNATQCGPASCATCAGYSGVENPGGFRVCYPYCQADTDCAPDSAGSADITPRCVLGQCVLLCRTSSTCARDSQCMPWLDSRNRDMYPGFDGLCN